MLFLFLSTRCRCSFQLQNRCIRYRSCRSICGARDLFSHSCTLHVVLFCCCFCFCTLNVKNHTQIVSEGFALYKISLTSCVDASTTRTLIAGTTAGTSMVDGPKASAAFMSIASVAIDSFTNSIVVADAFVPPPFVSLFVFSCFCAVGQLRVSLFLCLLFLLLPIQRSG